MKDFDFVKFTIVSCLLMTLVCAGGYYYLGGKLERANRDLENTKEALERIGALSGNIDRLETEKSKDLGQSYPPNTYFHEMANLAGIDSRSDYQFSPRSKDKRSGYQDQDFTLTFKREKRRERLFRFIYLVEQKSPRYRLVKAMFRLNPRDAKQDRWTATLDFLRRDPLVTE